MDRDPEDQRRADLRASDADRERFVEALRRHQADGRLTTDELAERTERAYAAWTLGDQDALATDLPELTPSVPPPRPAGSQPLADLAHPRLRVVPWVAGLQSPRPPDPGQRRRRDPDR
jgi:Domain of unknown function (DUF1707)